MHFYKQLKKDSGPKHSFNLHPGGSADFLQHLPAFSDEDCLLPLALAVNYRSDSCELRSFLILFDLNGSRVWHLFARSQQNLLTDNFGGHKTCRLIRKLILMEITRSLR